MLHSHPEAGATHTQPSGLCLYPEFWGSEGLRCGWLEVLQMCARQAAAAEGTFGWRQQQRAPLAGSGWLAVTAEGNLGWHPSPAYQVDVGGVGCGVNGVRKVHPWADADADLAGVTHGLNDSLGDLKSQTVWQDGRVEGKGCTVSVCACCQRSQRWQVTF